MITVFIYKKQRVFALHGLILQYTRNIFLFIHPTFWQRIGSWTARRWISHFQIYTVSSIQNSMWRQLEVLRDRKGHRQRRWSVDYEPCLSYKLRGGSKWNWGSAVWKWSWPESFIVSIEQKRSDDGGALQRHIKLNGKLSSLLFRFCFLSRKKKNTSFSSTLT